MNDVAATTFFILHLKSQNIKGKKIKVKMVWGELVEEAWWVTVWASCLWVGVDGVIEAQIRSVGWDFRADADVIAHDKR